MTGEFNSLLYMLRKFALVSLSAFVSVSVLSSIALAQDEDYRFEFEDFPTSVDTFEDFGFTLKALNAAGELDSSYTGTVEFISETDSNAVLPSDFTFEPADGGEHVFPNTIFFTEEGSHILRVQDLEDEDIYAEIEFIVNGEAVSSGDGVMVVDSPTSGTSTSNVITFSGEVDPGLEVRIYDRGQILDTVDASSDGEFIYRSSVLPDGDYVFTLETDTSESNEINVTIDSGSSSVTSVALQPSSPGISELVTIKVDLSDTANSVKVIINGVKTTLSKSDTIGRSFSGQFSAPSSQGTYGITVEITDELGNTSSVNSDTTLVVGDPFALEGDELTFFVPSQVTGIRAISSDRRISLTWNPAQDNTGIAKYLIKYGSSLDNLDLSVQTASNDTSWYIPNLVNGNTYYFQVFGIDTEGNLGDQGSQIVSASPSLTGSNSLHGSADGQVLVDETTGTGPEHVIALLLSSLCLAVVVRRKYI